MKKQSTTAYIINLIIGLFFMFVWGKIVPTWATLNNFGVASIGILIGALWMTTHGFGLMGPSMLSFFAIVFSGYLKPAEVLAKTLGDQNVYLVMMCLVLTFAFTDCGAGDIIARKMISSKALSGKPYLFTGVFLVVMFILGTLVGAMSLCLIAFAFIDAIGKAVGYDGKSHWTKMMLTIIMIAAGAAGAVLPFKAGPMMVISMIRPSMTEAGIAFKDGLYMIAALIGGLLFIGLTLLALKPIFKVDLSKLQDLDAEALSEGKATKLNTKQKLVTLFMCIGFAYSIVTLFLPSGNAFSAIGLPLWLSLMVIVISFIRVDGEPLFALDRTFGRSVIWGPTFAAAAFTLIGQMMAAPDNGVRPWLTKLFGSILGGLPFPIFILLIIIIAVVCTNFFSNSATAVILASIVAPLAIGYATGGVNPTIFCAAIANSTGVAYLTMGAGGVAPVYLGLDSMRDENKWLWKNGPLLGLIYIIGAAISYIIFGLIG